MLPLPCMLGAFLPVYVAMISPPPTAHAVGTAPCPLCQLPAALWASTTLSVVAVPDAAYPGYTRVVWHRHQAEMTDLDAAERQWVMAVVWCIEAVMRQELAPHKVNLAALGNMVPHLHWHVIPRWPDDPHFPDAIWAPPRRAVVARPADAARLSRYHQVLITQLNALKASCELEGRER